MMKNNCTYTRQNVFGYIEKTLDENTFSKIESHLVLCPKCRSYYEFIEITISNEFNKSQIEASPYFYSKLLTKMENMSARRYFLPAFSQTKSFLSFFYISMIIMAIILGINIGSINNNNDIDPMANTTKTLSEEDEYLEHTTANKVFNYEYLNIIQNGSNSTETNR